MSNVVYLNDSNFDSAVSDNESVVLVDFTASWCMPCKQLSPVIDSLAGELVGRVKVCKADVDEAPEACTRHNIRSVPTLMVFKGGEKVGSAVGVLSRDKILSLLAL